MLTSDLYEASHRLCRLCSTSDPFIDLLEIKLYEFRVRAGVVSTYFFDEAPVAFCTRICDDHAIIGGFLGTVACQADPYCQNILLFVTFLGAKCTKSLRQNAQSPMIKLLGDFSNDFSAEVIEQVCLYRAGHACVHQFGEIRRDGQCGDEVD